LEEVGYIKWYNSYTSSHQNHHYSDI